MVSIDIEINDVLFKQIDYIEIYNEGGFLAQYMRDILKNRRMDSFLNQNMTQKKVVILKYVTKKFCHEKIKQHSDRTPMKTIYSELVKIPFVQAHNSDCAICLESVVDNRYISVCQYMFYTTCIFDYARQNNYIKSLAEH